jgi:hypothetical protein
MPARKLNLLNKRSLTKDNIAARIEAESSTTPRTLLTLKPPQELKGHKKAESVWKWAIGLYSEIDGTIATAFDEPTLIDVCMLKEEIPELVILRATQLKDYEARLRAINKIKAIPENEKILEGMWKVVNGSYQNFKSTCARLDSKRKLLHLLGQSLYLTPRSRAGVPVPEKPKAEEKSAMDNLLD